MVNSPINVQFENQAKSLGTFSAPNWLHAWPKQDSQIWAKAEGADSPILGGYWNIGRGSVAAMAFIPDADSAGKIAELIRRHPRDPRFSVSVQTGSELSVTIYASLTQSAASSPSPGTPGEGRAGGLKDNPVPINQPMNDVPIELRLQTDADTTISLFQQTAPGQYTIHLPVPRQFATASIVSGNSTLDQFCIAGRYAQEFEELGNDHDAMNRLALQSGGKIISPADHGQLDISAPPRDFPLAPYFSIGAAISLAFTLISLRRIQ
jgi:hypothetical protein